LRTCSSDVPLSKICKVFLVRAGYVANYAACRLVSHKRRALGGRSGGRRDTINMAVHKPIYHAVSRYRRKVLLWELPRCLGGRSTAERGSKPEGDSYEMNAETPPQWIWRAASWLHARPAILGTCAGAALGVSTVILSAINAISAQQAIAMALPSMVAVIGGLVHMIVHDSWTAWQRGFQQGCRVSIPCQLDGLHPGVVAALDREDGPDAERQPSPTARGGLHKVL
jgi:hypothetical protein